MNEYDQMVRGTSNYTQSTDSLFTVVVALLGEIGEYANKLKKAKFKQTLNDAEQIADFQSELGDVLWYLTELCHQHGLTLEEVARANAIKVIERQQLKKTYNMSIVK